MPELFMKKVIFLSVVLLFLSACKTSKPAPPAEMYLNAAALPASTIRLPLEVSLDDLEKSINQQIDLLIADGSAVPEDFGNGVKVKVRKSDAIQLEAKGRSIVFDVPLDLVVKKSVGFTSLEANGSITLKLQTVYDIDKDWNIKTVTTIPEHCWTKKPNLDMGIIKIPLEGIADKLIARSKATITSEIDKQLQERFALKAYAQLAVDTLRQPFLLSEEYDAWLAIRPKKIAMAPLKTSGRKVSTTLLLEAHTDIFVNKNNNTNVTFKSLPPLQEEAVTGEGYEFYFQTKIPYQAIEAEAKKQLIGEVFQDGNRKVKIEDIRIYGQNNQLVVNALLSGSYKGSIYLIGRPVYNEDKGVLELADFDFELSTRQYLKKSMAWLLQRTLKKQFQESLNYPVKQDLEASKIAIQEELKCLVQYPQLALSGTVDELTIQQLFIEKDHLVLALYASGLIKLEVTNLFLKY
jgi:Domain of unknown function (DUF4403)